MRKYLNILYVIIVASLAIFAIKLQLIGQLKDVDQALTNQSQAVESLRSDINTIATFLNERTNVRVQTTKPLTLPSDEQPAEGENAGQ
ncbi:hypothetical protein BK004_00480 [bacterium CG10_46_32]|nr:MAG: hypothetical protein BK004_00480 [bacterium CG10_46_32]PIR56503.1 MAG: hypothetical protein COU73_00475 [Parcubacteria group bacterium CG10_big_fil_rev_8_21_14_0_10_46_32]